MKNIFLIILFAGLIVAPESYAQSSLINALPLQYNPSFAGSAGNARIAASGYVGSHKYYSVLNPNDYTIKTNSSSGISYDQFFSKFHTGLGLTLNYSNNNYSDDFSYRINNLDKFAGSVAISPKFSFQGKYTLAPSIQGIFGSDENLFFPVRYKGTFFTIRTGLLFNAKNFYIGYTIDVLNEQFGATKYSYQYKFDSLYYYSIARKGVYKVPFNSNIQLGYTFQKKAPSKFSFTPQLIIYIRNRRYNDDYYNYYSKGVDRIANNIIDNAVINLNFKFNRFLVANLLGNGRLGLMAGYQNKNLKLAYTQYISVGENSYFGYGGQLSFRYLFNSKSENKLPSTNY